MGRTACTELVECVEWIHSTRGSELAGRADGVGEHFICIGSFLATDERRHAAAS